MIFESTQAINTHVRSAAESLLHLMAILCILYTCGNDMTMMAEAIARQLLQFLSQVSMLPAAKLTPISVWATCHNRITVANPQHPLLELMAAPFHFLFHIPDLHPAAPRPPCMLVLEC
mmetsp:Transcript_4616/g.8286  ORF Transcript_4616/g.8286 Transcript_4616/m.8286 type:complete len:118 (+) Transcript_4616:17-370(+)